MVCTSGWSEEAKTRWRVIAGVSGYTIKNVMTVLTLLVVSGQGSGANSGFDNGQIQLASGTGFGVELLASLSFLVLTSMELYVDITGDYKSRREWGVLSLFSDINWLLLLFVNRLIVVECDSEEDYLTQTEDIGGLAAILLFLKLVFDPLLYATQLLWSIGLLQRQEAIDRENFRRSVQAARAQGQPAPPKSRGRKKQFPRDVLLRPFRKSPHWRYSARILLPISGCFLFISRIMALPGLLLSYGIAYLILVIFLQNCDSKETRRYKNYRRLSLYGVTLIPTIIYTLMYTTGFDGDTCRIGGQWNQAVILLECGILVAAFFVNPLIAIYIFSEKDPEKESEKSMMTFGGSMSSFATDNGEEIFPAEIADDGN